MATTINKTNGNVLTVVQDGSVDLGATNIALVGRLYRNYGELINENFVKLLENFANTSSPSTPIVGQLWYNTTSQKLQVYRTNGFVGIGVVTNSNAEPNSPALGDLWFDTSDNQLKLWTGSKWEVMAPQYSSAQGKSGLFVETITDSLDVNHIAVLLYQQGTVIAIFSKDSTYSPKNAISGFTNIVYGMNLTSAGKMNGLATNSELLDGISSESFLRSDAADSATGTITFASDAPMVLGADSDLAITVSGSTFNFTKNTNGSIRFSTAGGAVAEANDSLQFTVADGSAALPSLSFIGDPNTGIYRVGSNVIGFATDGNNRLSISNSGIVSDLNITSSATVSGATGTFSTVNATGSLNASLIVGNPVINGNMSVTGSATVTGNAIVNGTINIAGVTTISNNADITGVLNLPGASVTIPNDLAFTGGDVGVYGDLGVFGNSNTTGSHQVDVDLIVGDDATVGGELLVQYNSGTGKSALRVDNGGRVLIGVNGPVVAALNSGDVTLGVYNHIHAFNTARYWVAWQDNGPLGILEAHDVDSITRYATGKYRLNLSYFMTTNSYAAVVGMSSYGNMNMLTFPVGGDYVDVEIELYNYSQTNGSAYNSVVIFGV